MNAAVLDTWLGAFLLTQAVEIPIYLRGARRLPLRRRWILAAGASTLTHPLLWFAVPWASDVPPYWVKLAGGESAVIAVEALFCGRLGLRRPWLWSAAANLASVAAGVALRWLLPATH
jgi:hypothetical protein